MLEFLFNKVAGLKACVFIEKETPTQVFSCEYWEIFKNSFSYRAPPVHDTFPKFYAMIKFFGRLWVQNWYFSYFLYHCFVFLHNPSVRIGGPLLFCTCFHAKIFSKCNFYTHYNVGSSAILIESLMFRNKSRIIAIFAGNILWKMWTWVVWVLCFVNIFL